MAKTYTTADITDDRPLADKEKIVADWNAFETGRAMREWKAKMLESDTLLPRFAEDIIDKLGADGLATDTAEKAAAKKALRATKPSG